MSASPQLFSMTVCLLLFLHLPLCQAIRSLIILDPRAWNESVAPAAYAFSQNFTVTLISDETAKTKKRCSLEKCDCLMGYLPKLEGNTVVYFNHNSKLCLDVPSDLENVYEAKIYGKELAVLLYGRDWEEKKGWMEIAEFITSNAPVLEMWEGVKVETSALDYPDPDVDFTDWLADFSNPDSATAARVPVASSFMPLWALHIVVLLLAVIAVALGLHIWNELDDAYQRPRTRSKKPVDALLKKFRNELGSSKSPVSPKEASESGKTDVSKQERTVKTTTVDETVKEEGKKQESAKEPTPEEKAVVSEKDAPTKVKEGNEKGSAETKK